MNEKVTAYITKYALKGTIYKMIGEVFDERYFRHSTRKFLPKPHWHLTLDEAIQHAEEMKRKK